MSRQTKILVLHMKELVYTAIFAVLGIILIILLVTTASPSCIRSWSRPWNVCAIRLLTSSHWKISLTRPKINIPQQYWYTQSIRHCKKRPRQSNLTGSSSPSISIMIFASSSCSQTIFRNQTDPMTSSRMSCHNSV